MLLSPRAEGNSVIWHLINESGRHPVKLSCHRKTNTTWLRFRATSKAKLSETEGRHGGARDMGQKRKRELCCPGCVKFLLN